MMMGRDSRRLVLFAAVFAALAVIGIGILYLRASRAPEAPAAAVPSAPEIPAGWEIYEDPASGASFAYPASLGTIYLSTTDWPPELRMSDEPFSCLEAGSESAPGGATAATWLSPDQPACVTVRSEGAAGSIYRLYAYAIALPSGQAFFTFGLRFPQCANYDDPERAACAAEQEAFDADALMRSIFETLRTRDSA